MARSSKTLSALLAIAPLLACSGPGLSEDPCESSDMPSAVLGNGVGGAFAAFSDNAEVSLSVAPQGGFGVSVIVRTVGLAAGATSQLGSVQLNVEDQGVVIGEFLQENQPIACRGIVAGGEVRNVVVGFDPETYNSPEEIATLNNRIFTLAVTVKDAVGGSAVVRTPVTIVVEN